MSPTISPHRALTLLAILSVAGCGSGVGGDTASPATERVGAAAALRSGSSGAVGLAALGLSSPTLTAGSSITGTVTLAGPAPSGGVIVYLGFQSTILAGPKFIRISNGQIGGTFTLYGNPFLSAATSTSVSATTSSPQPFSFLTETISVVPSPAPPATAVPQVSSLVLSPMTVRSGDPSTGTVTLTAPAPASGTVVQLSSSGDFFNLETEPPPVVVVPAGQTSATFTVRTHLPTTLDSFDAIVVGTHFGGPFQGDQLTITR